MSAWTYRAPARLLASGAATDPVRDHREERQTLAVGRHERAVRQAREVHLKVFPQRADEEVIFVGAADLADVGDAVDVDFVVPRLAAGRCDELVCRHVAHLGAVTRAPRAILRPRAPWQ